jgi:hypothetical protein
MEWDDPFRELCSGDDLRHNRGVLLRGWFSSKGVREDIAAHPYSSFRDDVCGGGSNLPAYAAGRLSKRPAASGPVTHHEPTGICFG